MQRLGRVNRLGRGSAAIDVVHVIDDDKGDGDAQTMSTAARTVEAIKSLPANDGGWDASPSALRLILDRTDAFSKPPRTLPLTEILLDGWAMTRLPDLPGRLPVERWLHGVEASRPQLHVAWRQEIRHLAKADDRLLKPLFEKHPILSRERLRGNLDDVSTELKKLAKRAERTPVVLLPVDGSARLVSVEDLLVNDLPHDATIILPPDAGGLNGHGMLDGSSPAPVSDVADTAQSDQGRGLPERLRVLLQQDSESETWTARPIGVVAGEWRLPKVILESGGFHEARRALRKFLQASRMAEKASFELERDDEGETTKALLLLTRSKAVALVQDSPSAAARQQYLDEHLSWTQDEAEKIVSKLGLHKDAPLLADAIAVAARWHDRGKDRAAWQAAIGNPPPRQAGNSSVDWKPLAKSGHRGFDAGACGKYRHEFGSLRQAAVDPAITCHAERDLILHLIAAHHGWARPHFEHGHADIAEGISDEENAEVSAEAMRRFARLQRRFGRWGLAWLEALLRSADYAATRRLSEDGRGGREAAK